MRRCVLAMAGVALLATFSWSSAPAQAMAISAPAALKAASDGIKLTEAVHCWDCGYYGGPRYYRPRYRSYDRPYYRPYDRPYYRSHYYSDYAPRYSRPYYRPYYRPAYRPDWDYGYAPRPRFYIGPRVFSY
jgi:hypothetical protein